MPATRRAIVKQARSCHSKAAWQRFFQEPQVQKRLKTDRRVRSVIFSLLQKDPLSPNYDPAMWADFIRNCQKAWDQPMAESICRHMEGVHDPDLNLAMAETYLEGGHPQDVKKLAYRCLKQPGLDEFHRVNFELILSSGYLVEGKQYRAEQLLKTMDLKAAQDQNSAQKSAFTCRNLARMYFSRGAYPKAGTMFSRAAKYFTEDKNHIEAALSHYNSAAAFDNAGHQYCDDAAEQLKKARRLATCYEIRVVSSYCYCYSGVVNYQKGTHKLALDNLKLALELLPKNELGVRRVQILGFICLVLHKLGQYDKADAYYEERKALCAKDPEVAKAAAFPLLDAEVLWSKGDWEGAAALLGAALEPFKDREVTTIDDLALVAKFLTLNALAGKKIHRKRFKVAPCLEGHRHTWLCYSLAKALQQALTGDDKANLRTCEKILKDAKDYDSISARQGALALILSNLTRQGQFDESFASHRQELALALESNPNSQCSLVLIDIAKAYRQNEFKKARELVLAHRDNLATLNVVDRTVIEALSKAAEGKIHKFSSDVGQRAVDRYCRDYLRPTICLHLPESVSLGHSLEINFSCQATVAKFIALLAEDPTRPLSTSTLQQKVWQQSLNQKNWKQKIRNTVSRIRMLFKPALVPVVLQDSNEVMLNHDIITFTRPAREDSTDAAMIELLRHNKELSSTELAKLMDLSRSTTKRKLKKALATRQIQSKKKGRNIYYSVS